VKLPYYQIDMIFQASIVDLRQFYSAPLGRLLRRDLGRAIHHHFGNIPKGKKLAGLGFAVPHLRLNDDANIIAVMFAHLGAMYWPADGLNHSVLAHEGSLPFDDDAMDYMLLTHAVEHSLHLNNLLSEVFRCLKPNGKVLLVAPNRRGWWQLHTDNPFGVGNAFHAVQLRHRGELAGLSFVKQSSALFYPPSTKRFVQKISLWLEYLGLMIAPNWGGVLLLEFEKQLYEAIPEVKKVHFHAGILQPKIMG
jgi:SAM-dependent methyltransferase